MPTKPILPSYVVWEITPRCQLDCVHCFNAKLRTTEPSKDVLLKIASVLNQKDLAVLISGGDPLLSPALIDIVASLDDVTLIDIQTNGILLRKRIDAILDALPRGVKLEIGVPIDGCTARTHDAVRVGVKDHFKIVMDAIELLKSLPRVSPYVTTCLTSRNVHEFDGIMALVKQHDIGWVVGSARPSGNATTDVLLDANQQGTWMKSLFRSFDPFSFFPYEIIPWVLDRDATFSLPRACMVLTDRSFRVDLDGTCHSCCFANSPFAKVPDDAFHDVMRKRRDHPFVTRARTLIGKSTSKCATCTYRANCHGCPLYPELGLEYPCPTDDLETLHRLLKPIATQRKTTLLMKYALKIIKRKLKRGKPRSPRERR